MVRTIVIDRVQAVRLQVQVDAGGNVQLFAEYVLSAGTVGVQRVYREITPQLTAARRSEARALYDAVSREIAAFEQV